MVSKKRKNIVLIKEVESKSLILKG